MKKKDHEHTWNLNILGLRSFILNHKRKYHLLSYWSNNNFVKAFGLYGLLQRILIPRKSPNLRYPYPFVFVVKTSRCLKIYRNILATITKIMVGQLITLCLVSPKGCWWQHFSTKIIVPYLPFFIPLCSRSISISSFNPFTFDMFNLTNICPFLSPILHFAWNP